MNKPTIGRPPMPASERASSQIQLRVSRKRKASYVRAARPGTLAGWIFGILDKACGFEEDK